MNLHAIRTMAAKEMRDFVLSPRYVAIVMILLLTLLLFAVFAPWMEYQNVLQEQDAPWASAGYLDRWLEDNTPLSHLAGFLEFPLVGGVALLQLFALLFCADAVGAERSGKTLGLLITKPIARRDMILGKYLARFTLMGAATVATYTLTFTLLQWFLPGGSASDWLTFAGTLGILLLGVAGFCALGVFLSAVTLSPMQATVIALPLWLFALGGIGAIGLMTSLADDDFRNEGQLDLDAVTEECGEDPRWSRDGDERTDQDAIEAYETCREPFDQEVEQYYVDRGVTPYDAEAAFQVCGEMRSGPTLRADQDHENGTDHATNEEANACYEAAQENATRYEEEKRQVLAAKFQQPRVEWSFYATPKNPMHLATVALGSEAMPYPPSDPLEAFFVGQTVPPSNMALGVAVAAAWPAVLLWGAVAVVARRDFG